MRPAFLVSYLMVFAAYNSGVMVGGWGVALCGDSDDKYDVVIVMMVTCSS
jgi:hypothetical protein